MRRRTLLISTAACAMPLTLLGCCGTSPSIQTLSAQILADANAALTQLGIVLPPLSATSPPVLASDQIPPLIFNISEARSALATLSATTSTTSGLSVLAMVVGYVNAVLDAVPIAMIPFPYGLIVIAVTVIAREIEVYIASIQPPAAPSPAPAATRAARFAPGMSTAEARQILHADTQ